jgi:hypothetical protein
VAGLEQALGHGIAHAAHADPTDPLLALCHCNSPCSAWVEFARSLAHRETFCRHGYASGGLP